ncbi:hypothetical protein ACFL6U_23255 [Planctomycetota bacterium]
MSMTRRSSYCEGGALAEIETWSEFGWSPFQPNYARPRVLRQGLLCK